MGGWSKLNNGAIFFTRMTACNPITGTSDYSSWFSLKIKLLGFWRHAMVNFSSRSPHRKDRLPPCQKERVRNCVITATSSLLLLRSGKGGRGGGCPNQGEALFCTRRPIYQSSHREQTLLFQHLFPFLLWTRFLHVLVQF